MPLPLRVSPGYGLRKNIRIDDKSRSPTESGFSISADDVSRAITQPPQKTA
jgi:hypothetical protein